MYILLNVLLKPNLDLLYVDLLLPRKGIANKWTAVAAIRGAQLYLMTSGHQARMPNFDSEV